MQCAFPTLHPCESTDAAQDFIPPHTIYLLSSVGTTLWQISLFQHAQTEEGATKESSLELPPQKKKEWKEMDYFKEDVADQMECKSLKYMKTKRTLKM